MWSAADRGSSITVAQAPIRGRHHHAPLQPRGEMVIGQDGRGPRPVGMAPSLIREYPFMRERYEFVEMASQIVDQTRSISPLIHKVDFVYESSAPSPARANRSVDMRSKRYHRNSDGFVACCARAISLLF